MKKRIFVFLFLVILCVALCACSSRSVLEGNTSMEEPSYSEDGGDAVQTADETTPDRKIIYEVSFSIYTDDLTETVDLLRSKVAADEWFDNETVRDNYAYFTVRVKSDRIDAFVNSLTDGGEKISDYTKSAKDISLSYQSTENRIASLNAESARLNQLMAEATTTELISINKRLSEIELELGELQGTLNSYDSLVDYSEITISLYNQQTYTEPPFGEKLSGVFSGAWVALGNFFKWLVIALTAMFPFIVTIGPVVAGIIVLAVFLKKRKKAKFAKQSDSAKQVEEGKNKKDDN